MKSYVALFICLLTIPIGAQLPAPPKAPSRPAAPAAPSAPAPPRVDPSEGGQPINIRLDVSVNDQAGTSVAQPKTLMVMLVDRASGQTRAAFEDRSISVDARPTIVDGRIRVSLIIVSRQDSRQAQDLTLSWQNSFSLMLENGKPMIAMETSDAVTKRKMSIEVKATIQK